MRLPYTRCLILAVGLVFFQPSRNINYLNAFVGIWCVLGSGEDHFWIGVLDLEIAKKLKIR